jgi:hypothetical protein
MTDTSLERPCFRLGSGRASANGTTGVRVQSCWLACRTGNWEDDAGASRVDAAYLTAYR